ncbi:site-specific DNA-methyltransferase [Treponema sp. Marseille-Q4523]|uniref:site-specific DNA-methyltransferase n=1 Tax=Treponema sp. Marseille-Q4523 TaxID=2810610 RepID=UPI00195FE9E4|nr:site-specific DNA-methyltransferase [Treponema sp. Marseille-Q4523]MBM7021922.1 site-specific DNA-methyltransferase [Treponema sp. Marseille-Q4523]
MPNLSQIKRQRMLDFLAQIKEEHKDDDAMLIALGEIESELNAKKYGLVWEQHEEAVDVKMRTHIPVFKEDTDREITTAEGEVYNFLLEGDNLHSLRLLEKTHKGRIDVIYIDPPYNRGKDDFVYDDNYVGTEDSFKHSKWLSFMEKRLRIAYSLLSEDGLMFVSIDDNEQAALKNLIDEIFSEDNFIIAMPRITKKSGKTTGSFSKNHDYVLVYTKQNKDIFVMEEHIDPAFQYEDEWVEERGKYKLNQALDYDSLSYSASLDYPLTVEGETFYPGGNISAWQERQNGNHRRADWAWRWNQKLFDFGYKNGFVVIKRKPDGSARIYTKTYLNARIEKDENGEYSIEYVKRTKPLSSIGLIENQYSNDNAKKDLAIFGLKDDFDYSKPVELIKRLIKNHYNKNAIVLDFFAGSGTTAQAVLELNIEDGGQRTFILCTNNQNNICEEVTYKRCSDILTTYHYENSSRTVLLERKIKISDFKDSTIPDEIAAIKAEYKSEYKKFATEIKDAYLYFYGVTVFQEYTGLPANLKYYRTDFVSKDEEDLSDALLNHIAEMIQLEHGVKLDAQHYIMILDDDEADALAAQWNEYTNVKALYVSKNVLFTTEQNALFRDVEIHIIPDYYFNFELREVGETW